MQKVIKDATEDIKELVEEAEQFDDNSKSIIYNRFLNNLSRRVKRFRVSRKQAEEWIESLDTGVHPRFQDMIGSIRVAGENGEGYFAAETEEERAALNPADEKGFFGDTQEDELNTVIDQKKEALEDHAVNFVYLGDILDVACKMARSENNNQVDSKMKILTGPVM
ncbi:MAG TPA: hypothetical protein DCM40_25135, partial [Maribacter sp.]|nr:hypothetical protein [Maribacter sp.]